MRKPSWMTMEVWADFINLHPLYRCALCGDVDERLATVDHIVSRFQGGTNDPSNLRWACSPCNSSKGPRDDPYWSQYFYFDRAIDLEACRYAQRVGAYGRIFDYPDWFTRPFSQISGKLHVLNWIVGSGKTLAGPVVAFALNHLIRRDLGTTHPRVDRVLILTKEQAIRDQVVANLQNEVTGYGLCAVAPRVINLVAGDLFQDARDLDRYDVAVACIHMLIEKNGRAIPNLREVLAHFPLIIIDEPHWSVDQVLTLVGAASSSLCFGTTGSPIDADGKQLKSFVNFHTYGYWDACENDQSLKSLPAPATPGWREMYEEVDIATAEMHGKGSSYLTYNSRDDGYDLNIRPVISVAESVVRHVHESDQSYPIVDPEESSLFDSRFDLAEHRESPPCVADLAYPLHAMIRVETVEIGKIVEDHITRMFEANRSKYRLSEGYRILMVHSANLDGDGKAQAARKLPPDHAWMYAKRNKGYLSPAAARFLVVVGMAREGVSNEFCGVVGLACRCQSMIEFVQRVFGRQIRSFVRREGEMLRVPPADLDTVKIITHSTFGNRPHAEKAALFLLNMEDYLKGMTTLEQLVAGEDEDVATGGLRPERILTSRERIQIAGVVGGQRNAGREGVDVDWIEEVFGGPDEPKRQGVREWTKTVIESPPIARKYLGLIPDLREIPRVMREHYDHVPSDETLARFLKREHPKMVHLIPRLVADEGLRGLVIEIYIKHVEQFHTPDLPVITSLSKINRGIGKEVKDKLAGLLRGDGQRVYPLTYLGMRAILGCPDGTPLEDKGPYNVPECHAILARPEVRRDVVGWVINGLARQGHCPDLAAGLGIVVDDAGTIFTEPEPEPEMACDVS